MDREGLADQLPLRAVNAFFAAIIGFVAGGAASFVFTNSVCNHTAADSMCGTMIMLLGPGWALAVAFGCAVVAALIPIPPDISGSSWAGAILAQVLAIALFVPACGAMLRYPPATVTSKYLRQVETVADFVIPFALTAAGALGGVAARLLFRNRAAGRS